MAKEKEAAQVEGASQDDQITRTKHRSPNYPVIGLRKAIQRAEELYKKYKRNHVPIGIAHQLWGYREHSGAGNQVVSAMKAFGLLDVTGDGKTRKVRISDISFRILHQSNDRVAMLRKAAISPSIYKELWKKYEPEGGIPETEILKHYLLHDREDGTFNPDVIDNFISNFKDSLHFAGLSVAGIMPEGSADGGDLNADLIPEVGSLVQWTSGGVDQFKEPRRLIGVSDDGDWAFVEGSETGLPISELIAVNDTSATSKQDDRSPPVNPFFKSSDNKTDTPPPGTTEEKFTLDEGPVSLRWPSDLSKDSVEELEEWIDVLLKRARRKAGIDQRKS